MEKSFLKIGHCGAKGHISENTLESIKKAIDLGVDAVEIDVHRCASGELVVFQDFTLDRMTNYSGEVSKHTLNQLRKVTVKGNYKIPTLSEVLISIDNKCILIVNLKGLNTELETNRLVTFFVEKKGWEYSNIIIISYRKKALKKVYDKNQEIPLGVLTASNLEDAVNFAEIVNAVAIFPNYTLLTEEIVGKLKENFKVYTYTVNNLKPISRIKSYGVDGIITDFPDRL
jgi:glycerophosphoryl diester phosphodiesterase